MYKSISSIKEDALDSENPAQDGNEMNDVQ